MKSPLKDSPLRNPGESLDRQIDKLINDKAISYIIAMMVAIVLAGLEWWRWHNNLEPDPVSYTVIAAIVTPFCLYKIIRISRQVKRLRQGREGEKAVGQYLESLREASAKVFHDIPAKGFNIDHVVITKSGIYVIETKT